MSEETKWRVVLVIPGEDELSLLAELTERKDVHVVGLLDPAGESVGAGMAEIMSLPVFSSLEEIPEDEVRFLIHPPLSDEVAAIIDGSVGRPFTCVSAVNFANLLVDHALATIQEPRPAAHRVNFDFLEKETAAIHQTLGRIEEAMDREGLLRWLLKLATKAVGAAGGSIMLFDETTQELYVAFAHGMSQSTLHRTRIRLGEGISGMVAQERKAELIKGNRHPGAQRDRGTLRSAVCAPIIWQDSLLGVINVSAAEGDRDLAADALTIIENLSSRFGLILERFLRLQTILDGEIFRKLEEGFDDSTAWQEPSRCTLCQWAQKIQEISGADELSLSLMTAGGDLLVAHDEGVHYEFPPAPEKDAVLASGSPLVLRPSRNPADRFNGEVDPGRTIFHLPIGRGPAKALLTVVFFKPSKAHHFHQQTAEIIYLLNRHLATWLDKAEANDKVERLTILADTLTELSTLAPNEHAKLAERAVSAARRLTGAESACILRDESGPEECQDKILGADLRNEAVRLLQETRTRGWSSTILGANNQGGIGKSLLVVPLQPGQPFPGLVLVNKRRLHPLDGAAFTEFDALFARRLLPVFHAQDTREIPATLEVEPAAGSEVVPAPQPAVLAPVPVPAELAPSIQVEPVPAIDIRQVLAVEIDRSKRYHTPVGVIGLRCRSASGPVPDSHHLIRGLSAKLRTSDQAGVIQDGTILVTVPEEVQSLSALQTRLADLLVATSGQDDLVVQSAHRVYPGTGNNADELIEVLLNHLS